MKKTLVLLLFFCSSKYRIVQEIKTSYGNPEIFNLCTYIQVYGFPETLIKDQVNKSTNIDSLKKVHKIKAELIIGIYTRLQQTINNR